LRRPLDSVSSEPVTVKPAEGLPPLLAKMLDEQEATGLPPAYLPKDERDDGDEV